MNIVIGLNVGGQVYKTKRDTLTLFHESTLGRKFHNRVPKEKDIDGNYVLDRDGPLFRYVLNYLRDGKLALPADFSEFGQLTLEAEHFKIPGLLDAVKQAARDNACVHTPTYVTAEHVINSDTEKRKWRIRSKNIDMLWRLALNGHSLDNEVTPPQSCEENIGFCVELRDLSKKVLFEKFWNLGFTMNTVSTGEQACYEFVRRGCGPH